MPSTAEIADAVRYVRMVRHICSHAGRPELAKEFIAKNQSANFAMMELVALHRKDDPMKLPIIINHEEEFE